MFLPQTQADLRHTQANKLALKQRRLDERLAAATAAAEEENQRQVRAGGVASFRTALLPSAWSPPARATRSAARYAAAASRRWRGVGEARRVGP